MTIEVANTLDQLNPSYPRDVDLIKEGAKHIRLIKQVLKTTFPNVNKVVTMSADKVNNLDKTFSATNANGDITINGAITMASGKALMMGKNRLQDVSNPVAPQDAVTLSYVQSAGFRGQAWPVGSVYFSMTATNPGTSLGVGTWVQIAQGRFIVGQGGGNDGRDGQSFGIGNAGGFYKTQLVEGNLPPHAHRVVGRTHDDGNHTHPYRDRYYIEHEAGTTWRAPYREATPGRNYNAKMGSGRTDYDNDSFLYIDTNTSAAGQHGHNMDFWSQQTGGNQRFNTFPTAFGMYIWQRTA